MHESGPSRGNRFISDLFVARSPELRVLARIPCSAGHRADRLRLAFEPKMFLFMQTDQLRRVSLWKDVDSPVSGSLAAMGSKMAVWPNLRWKFCPAPGSRRFVLFDQRRVASLDRVDLIGPKRRQIYFLTALPAAPEKTVL